MPDSPVGCSLGLYNATVSNADINNCASLCIGLYASWCRSFDYYTSTNTCYFSPFNAAQVGGLESLLDYLHSNYDENHDSTQRQGSGHFNTSIGANSSNQSNTNDELVEMVLLPVRHYERRLHERNLESNIVVDGVVNIASSLPPSGSPTPTFSPLPVHVGVGVRVREGGRIVLGAGAQVTAKYGFRIDQNAKMTFASNASLDMVGVNATLEAAEDSTIEICE